jgi:hypothetical protein
VRARIIHRVSSLAVVVEMHENRIEATCYIKMDVLKERK